jgi:hypothetical protein
VFKYTSQVRRVFEAMRTTSRKFYLVGRLLLIAICTFSLIACELDTRVKITDSKVPPTFTLSGNGQLELFIVVGPYSNLAELEASKSDVQVIWKVSPGGHDRRAVGDLPQITYGQVPSGFIQFTPTSGAPPPLEEGKFYSIGTPSIGAFFRVLCFKVEHNTTIKVQCRER